jgi:hypothetical protein
MSSCAVWEAICAARAECLRLCQSGHASDLGPGLKGLGSGGSILAGSDVIAAEVEQVIDLVVGGEKALRLTGRFKPGFARWIEATPPKGLGILSKTWIPTFTRCPTRFLRF